MWARKRIDIGWRDLLAALGYALTSFSRLAAQREVEHAWPAEANMLACLTERTGFDLLLAALALPAGSEVLVSAVTIDDMARIIRQHGLVPVPVDLCEDDMSPRPDALEAARSPKSVAILAAHLFGGRFNMERIVDWAKANGLQVWEDCAQAYEGTSYRGHPQADAVMFSFGPIKTSTALGGGLIGVRNPAALERMRQIHARYPVQSRWSFLGRIVTYAAIKAMEGPRRFDWLIGACRLLGIDYDRRLSAAVRNLPGKDFLGAVRRRPATPLLRLLARRLRSFNLSALDQRCRKGQHLAQLLRGRVICPGAAAETHSFWVFPVRTMDPHRLTERLRAAGYDAAKGGQLRVIAPPVDRPQLAPTIAQQAMESIVFVPLYPEMPDDAVEHLAQVLLDACRR
jgi:dTDP-4-amino-4,6-dideoxygalactose transaminase